MDLLLLFPPLFPFLGNVVLQDTHCQASEINLRVCNSQLHRRRRFLSMSARRVTRARRPRLLPLSKGEGENVNCLCEVRPPQHVLRQRRMCPFPIMFRQQRHSFGRVVLSKVSAAYPGGTASARGRSAYFRPCALRFRRE